MQLLGQLVLSGVAQAHKDRPAIQGTLVREDIRGLQEHLALLVQRGCMVQVPRALPGLQEVGVQLGRRARKVYRVFPECRVDRYP